MVLRHDPALLQSQHQRRLLHLPRRCLPQRRAAGTTDYGRDNGAHDGVTDDEQTAMTTAMMMRMKTISDAILACAINALGRCAQMQSACWQSNWIVVASTSSIFVDALNTVPSRGIHGWHIAKKKRNKISKRKWRGSAAEGGGCLVFVVFFFGDVFFKQVPPQLGSPQTTCVQNPINRSRNRARLKLHFQVQLKISVFCQLSVCHNLVGWQENLG